MLLTENELIGNLAEARQMHRPSVTNFPFFQLKSLKEEGMVNKNTTEKILSICPFQLKRLTFQTILFRSKLCVTKKRT